MGAVSFPTAMGRQLIVATGHDWRCCATYMAFGHVACRVYHLEMQSLWA
jgi:hypothetical protein